MEYIFPDISDWNKKYCNDKMQWIYFRKPFDNKVPIISASYIIDKEFCIINIGQYKTTQNKKNIYSQKSDFKKFYFRKRRVNRKKMVQKNKKGSIKSQPGKIVQHKQM
jgi:hypothetical protein